MNIYKDVISNLCMADQRKYGTCLESDPTLHLHLLASCGKQLEDADVISQSAVSRQQISMKL